MTATELQGLKYKTVANANGSGNLTWTVTDNGTPAADADPKSGDHRTAVNDVPVRTAGTLTPISVKEDSANTTAVTLGLSGVTYGPGGGTDESEPDADLHGYGHSLLRADFQGERNDASRRERDGNGRRACRA